MIGQTISHYRILSKLGEGGMGVVYKAEDLTLGRTVALKFLPPDSVAIEDDRARLVHEARAAAALLHPNICPIHEIAESEGRIFIAMAYIEGRSLKDRIADGPLPLDEALSIARQMGDGLATAHAKGIIHRDIKPANIMLASDGRPILMDFGLAKVSGATRLTRTGMTMGTVAYMSPEQVKGVGADARSDIWALGVVLYEMIAGTAPFGGEYEAALLYSILNEDPEPLAVEGSDIPAGLDGIIAKALAKDPARRYQKGEDLVADLEALARDSAALPAGKAVPARGLRRLWRRWRPWQRAVAVVSVVAFAGAASFLLFHFWSSAPNAAKYSLAVMDFRDLATPDDPTASAGITELVNVGLIQADLVRIVSSDFLHDLRRRLFGSARGAIEEGQTLEIARKAGATLFLTGTIRQSGARKLLTWHLVNVESGDDVKGGRLEGDEFDLLADQIIADAVPGIARACGVEAKAAPTTVESITTESPRAYQHYMAGLLASEEGHHDDAIAEFERAVALDSTFALAYLELGRHYFWYFGGQKVVMCFNKAWSLKSRLGTKDQMRLEAWRENYGGSIGIGRSIAILREMRKRWPDDRQALIDLRNRLGSRWYISEAVQISEEGLRLYPDDHDIANSQYLIRLVSLGRTEDALRVARSYARRHPGEPLGWNDLGMVYLAAGLPDSAEAVFHKAVELDPRLDPDNSYELLVAFHRGDIRGATANLEKLLLDEDVPAYKRRYLVMYSHETPCLASLCIEAGRYTKMREVSKEYFTPRQMGGWTQTRLLVEMGQWQEIIDAHEQYDRLAKADTTLGPYYPRDLGKALAELGDTKGAREIATRLRKFEFESGAMVVYDANEIEARAALAERDPKTALSHLGEMRKSGVPWGGYIDIDYRTTLARAYRMDGKLDKAAEVHRQLLKVYGSHALSHYELATIYEEMKRPVEAKKEYAKFLEMWSEADEGLPQLVDARKRLAAL